MTLRTSLGIRKLNRRASEYGSEQPSQSGKVSVNRLFKDACQLLEPGVSLRDNLRKSRRALAYAIKDGKVRENISRLVSITLETNAQAAEYELKRILEDESRQPITYNHYYTDNIQNARMESSKSFIEDSVRNTIQDDWNGTFHLDNTERDCIKLLSSLKKRVIVDMKKQACSIVVNRGQAGIYCGYLV